MMYTYIKQNITAKVMNMWLPFRVFSYFNRIKKNQLLKLYNEKKNFVAWGKIYIMSVGIPRQSLFSVGKMCKD